MLSGLGCAHGRSWCFLWRCTDISIFTQLVSATPFSVEEILLFAASARPNLCWKRTLSRGEISISQLAASCRPSPSSPSGKAPAQRLLFPSAEQLSSYDALFKPRSPTASLTDRCGADCSLARHSLAQRCRGITPQLWQRLCRTRPGEEGTAVGLKPHWDIGNSCLAVGRGWERGVMVSWSRWLPAAGDGPSIAPGCGSGAAWCVPAQPTVLGNSVSGCFPASAIHPAGAGTAGVFCRRCHTGTNLPTAPAPWLWDNLPPPTVFPPIPLERSSTPVSPAGPKPLWLMLPGGWAGSSFLITHGCWAVPTGSVGQAGSSDIQW